MSGGCGRLGRVRTGPVLGDVPLSLEYKFEVWDSPNSAGAIIDALRAGSDTSSARDFRLPVFPCPDQWCYFHPGVFMGAVSERCVQ
jgi:hypothetical protein